MKYLVLALFISFNTFAEDSVVIPAFLDAADIYINGEADLQNASVLDPQTRAALQILQEKKVDTAILKEYTQNKNRHYELSADDQYDLWRAEPSQVKADVPEVALHAFKFDVVKPYGLFKDDIYAYYFVTDGVIPTGKVTSIYKGIGRGQSFFFNEIDRALFPLAGMSAKKPTNHLIVDYGIIRFNGDDVKKLQQLSSVIIDLAIAVYSSYDPQHAQVIVNLRKEIKALADMLLSLKSDERLVTESFGFKASELNDYFKDDTYKEFVKNHKAQSDRGWEYNLHFRLLKN